MAADKKNTKISPELLKNKLSSFNEQKNFLKGLNQTIEVGFWPNWYIFRQKYFSDVEECLLGYEQLLERYEQEKPNLSDEIRWLDEKGKVEQIKEVIELLKLVQKMDYFKKSILDLSLAIDTGKFADGTKFLIHTDRNKTKVYNMIEFFRRLPDILFESPSIDDASPAFNTALQKVLTFCQEHKIIEQSSYFENEESARKYFEEEWKKYGLDDREIDLILIYIKNMSLPYHKLVLSELADKYILLKNRIKALKAGDISEKKLLVLTKQSLFGHPKYRYSIATNDGVGFEISLNFIEAYDILCDLLLQNSLTEVSFKTKVEDTIKAKYRLYMFSMKKILERNVQYAPGTFNKLYHESIKQSDFLEKLTQFKKVMRILIDSNMTLGEKQTKLNEICNSIEDFWKLVEYLERDGRYKHDPNLADYDILFSFVRQFMARLEGRLLKFDTGKEKLSGLKPYKLAESYIKTYNDNPANFDERRFFEQEKYNLKEVKKIEKRLESDAKKYTYAAGILERYRAVRRDFWKARYNRNAELLKSAIETLREQQRDSNVTVSATDLLAQLPFSSPFYEEEFKQYALLLQENVNWREVFGFGQLKDEDVFYAAHRSDYVLGMPFYRNINTDDKKQSTFNTKEQYRLTKKSNVFIDTMKGRILAFARGKTSAKDNSKPLALVQLLSKEDMELLKQFFEGVHVIVPDSELKSEQTFKDKMNHSREISVGNYSITLPAMTYCGVEMGEVDLPVDSETIKAIVNYMESMRLPISEDVFNLCLRNFEIGPRVMRR